MEAWQAAQALTAPAQWLTGLGEAIFGSDEPSDWQKAAHSDAIRRQEFWAHRNEALQREFAKHGIRWRVEDAKAAGINPLVALGAGTTSFAPISVGDVGAPADKPRSSLSQTLGEMGQNISRAVQATATVSDRQQIQMNELQLENMKLQNTLLGQRIAAVQPSQIGPAQPEEAPIQPDMAFTKTARGGVAPVPSEGFADRAEDQFLPQISWAVRNLILPSDPKRSPGKGKVWSWNPVRFEFEPVNPPPRWWISPRSTWDTFRRWSNR